MDVLVDTHIIATEFDIDPLTAIMCVKPPCKANERVAIIEQKTAAQGNQSLCR